MQTDGRIRWRILGSPNCTYPISWSSNLLDWTEIAPVTLDAQGAQWFMDPDPTGYPVRFYRGQSQ